ncbi:MAG: acetolactate decarboxylase, partial [Caldilineales bacterium]|nr:acetolactate decarboxylase [Caldilineales bacterium]
RVRGRYSYIKARSVPKSECYLPLVEVARVQSVFEFHDASGVLVGFYTPGFMDSLSVPGLHLHFLADDFKSGGHLLECQPHGITVDIQPLHILELSLPSSQQYLNSDLTRDVRDDLKQAEN